MTYEERYNKISDIIISALRRREFVDKHLFAERDLIMYRVMYARTYNWNDEYEDGCDCGK